MVKRSRKKRTISAEHLAKMQAGRKRSQLLKKRFKQIEEAGLTFDEPIGYTERVLKGLRRK